MKRMIRIGIASCALTFAAYAHSTELALPRDGWVTWSVRTVENARAWRCFGDGRPNAANTTACRLDDERLSYSFDDPQPKMREHAAFAVARSQSLRKADDLIRLASTDRDTSVRSQAWFWLAQTAAPTTEAAINAALIDETEPRVRDQAIFALGQLPGDRATQALIGVAENRSLPRAERKQAVFRLAQEDSATALAYLEEVMMTASR